jgi:hypothetical protein
MVLSSEAAEAVIGAHQAAIAGGEDMIAVRSCASKILFIVGAY